MTDLLKPLRQVCGWLSDQPGIVFVGGGALCLAVLARERSAIRALKQVQLTSLPYVRSDQKQALLISNSKLFGLDYLEHCADHIRAFLGGRLESYVLFVPYALQDRDGYAAKARAAFKTLGYELRSLHEFDPNDRSRAVQDASALFVGGGNSFRLLSCLYGDGVMPLIKQRVEAGDLKYIGSSAGTNVACPTIRNTNDMPIVSPPSFAAMCIIPFQVNTHYIDKAREVQNHMGETRETRITEFTEENDIPVLALREGSSIRVEGNTATLLGPAKRSPEVTWEGARLFKRGTQEDVEAGACLDSLMALDPAKLFDTGAGIITPVSLKSG